MIRKTMTSFCFFLLISPGAPAQSGAPALDAKGVPPATTVPFTLAENLIVVEAEINGVVGNYLVDSGAQSIVLNWPRFSGVDIDTRNLGHVSPAGVGGAVQGVRGASGLQLRWGGVALDGLQCWISSRYIITLSPISSARLGCR